MGRERGLADGEGELAEGAQQREEAVVVEVVLLGQDQDTVLGEQCTEHRHQRASPVGVEPGEVDALDAGAQRGEGGYVHGAPPVGDEGGSRAARPAARRPGRSTPAARAIVTTTLLGA